MKTIFTIVVCIWSLNTLQAQWEPMDGPFGGHIYDLAKNDVYQFAASADGLFRSVNGKTWDKIKIIPGVRTSSGHVDVYDSLVVATVIELVPGNYKRHLFLSKTNGDTWSEIPQPPTKHIFGLCITGFGIYSYDFEELWFSEDEGLTWQLSSFPLDISTINYVSTYDHQLFIGSTGGIYLSSPEQDAWTFIAIPDPEAYVENAFVDSSLILAFAPNDDLLLRSADSGQSWTSNKDKRWSSNIYKNFVRMDSTYFMSLDSNIIKSTDKGMTWTKCDSRSYALAEEMITLDSSLLFATRYHGVTRSDDRGQSVYTATNGITASSIECIAIKDGSPVAASNYTGIFDYAVNENIWKSTYSDTFFSFFSDMLNFNSNLYVTDDYHIYRFSDADQSWMDISNVNSPGWYIKLFPFEDKLMVEHNGLEIWDPENETWAEFFIQQGGDTIRPHFFAEHSGYLFAGEDNQLFRKNVTNGLWETILDTDTLAGTLYRRLGGIYSIGDLIFIIIDYMQDSHRYRILKSDDHGETWQYADEGFPEIVYPWWSGFDNMQQIGSFAVVNAHNYSFGVVVSALDHIHWFPFNEGLPSLNVNDITFDEEYMYAATNSNGVWRRKISDLNTVSTHPIRQTNELSIFPNPSSGNFTIKLNSNLSFEARLMIYDLNGRACLSREIELKTETSIEMENLSSGLYIITLQTDDRIYTSKLIIQH